MFKKTKAFSSFSVNDLKAARKFYGDALGLDVEEIKEMRLLRITAGSDIMIYEKPDHVPATFTVLNFPVKELGPAMKKLRERGVSFEIYDMEGIKTDSDGVCDSEGIRIAWFKDPAGNILSVLEEK